MSRSSRRLTALRRGHFAPPNRLTSVVLILPLLIFYEVGILFTEVRNGADLLTQSLVHLLGIRGFVWLQAALTILLIGLVLYMRRTQRFELRQVIPLLLESGAYALTMGTLIVFLMVDLLGIDPRLAAGPSSLGLFDRLVMAVGAGVHEELLFRLVLLGAIAAIGVKGFALRPWLAVLVAMLLSSLAFSAAHHIGPLGEPLRLGPFVYRFIAGMGFASLYRFRSLATAIYTHALYDIYVLLWM